MVVLKKDSWINRLMLLLAMALLFVYRTTYSFDHWVPTTAFFVLLDMGCFWLCALVINGYLLPRWLYKRKRLLFSLGFVFLILGAAFFIQVAQWCWFKATGSIDEQVFEVLGRTTYQVFNSYLVSFFGCLVIFSYRLISDQWQAQARFEQLQSEKAKAELQYLKAQINPHFLFNSINLIFAEIDKSNTQAREMVLQFSDMLRYQLYECNSDKTSLEKEILYLKNYAGIQKLRRSDHSDIVFETTGDFKGFDIAPFLLIPFVENAFKFISNYDKQPNRMVISIKQEGGVLHFTCFNTRERLTGRSLVQEGGIGVENVKRRLELLYPGKHNLQITDNELTYETRLTIHLI